MKYRFINDHWHEFRVATMCRMLDVARAGYYQWLHFPMSDRDTEDQRLLKLILDSYTASYGVYSARRVCGDLREAGEVCSKNRVAKIMQRNGIKAIRRYRQKMAQGIDGYMHLAAALAFVTIIFSAHKRRCNVPGCTRV